MAPGSTETGRSRRCISGDTFHLADVFLPLREERSPHMVVEAAFDLVDHVRPHRELVEELGDLR